MRFYPEELLAKFGVAGALFDALIWALDTDPSPCRCVRGDSRCRAHQALWHALEVGVTSPHGREATFSIATPEDFKTRQERFRCLDCKEPNDPFMVTPEVWSAAGLKYKENICIPCLEVRLKRDLTLSDFSEAKINNAIRWAFKRGGS